MIIIPENYEELEISSNVKIIINLLKMKLNDENYLFISTNPTGIQEVPLILINQKFGIVCLNIDENKPSNFPGFLTFIESNIWDKQEVIFEEKLKREKFLLNNDLELKFNVDWLYIFPNLNKTSDIDNLHSNKNILFKEDIFKVIGNIEHYLAQELGELQNEITRNERDIIGFVIAPHYYIPQSINYLKNELEANTKRINPEELGSNLELREVKVLSLDKEQVKIINRMNYGNHLLLACAGSGKSALLIAKAFRFASIYKDKNVLILCFNNNLADYYRWRIEVAGLTTRNITCYTFHSLLWKLLKDINMTSKLNQKNSDFYFENLFNLVVKNFNEGKILPQYDAIFIDEIQIFKREWYKFSYNLLKSKEKDKHLFIIAGDKSQNVNDNMEKGLAPWQIDDHEYPSYQSNTIRIEMNYRNSIQINNYINNFVTIVKQYLIDIGFDITKREDLFLRGIATREGEKPSIIKSDRRKEVNEIFNIIDNLNNIKNVPLSEIAILIPQRKYTPSKYFILTWLQNEFSKRNMEYTLLINEENNFISYGERKGVIICTIESALGLDFEAVILCGLFPLGLYEKSYKLEYFDDKSLEVEELLIRKEKFYKNINQLYTAMTRAKNFLYVILSQTTENIYNDILITSQAGGQKDDIKR